MNENDILSQEEQIKLPKNNINDSYKYHFNYYSPNYHKDIQPTTYELNYNDIKKYNTSPKTFQNNPIYKKINNIIPHHHCHLSREHRHIHHTPQCRSNSSSPSPIKNISQPLYHTYYNSNMNGFNNINNISKKNNLLYNNNNNGNSQIFFSDDLSNDFSGNNNLIQKTNDNDEIYINDNNGKNHSNAMAFDDYMSKLVFNKYNKMKQFNESYYMKKQFGDETNYTNLNNNTFNTFNDDYIKDEFNTMRKNLEQKYKLYNKMTKYDNIELGNNLEENSNKNEEKEEKEEEINNKKNKEKKNKKKSKKNKIRKKHDKNSSSSSSDNSDFDSSPEKNNFVKDDKNNKNIIQKTFNENIGIKNSSYVSSTFNHVKEKDKNISNINNDQNINNSNLLEYLKKENDEIKSLNNNYKQTLDTLFYFLNNIFHKFRKDDKEEENNQKNDLFDLSKDVNNIETLSKKLINLESLINDNNKNDIKNKLKLNALLTITKENSLCLPEPTKLEKFNDLIEGINEKCFSFKDDNYIERYKNEKNENNIKIKNISEIEQKENIEKDFVNNINNDKDKCVACLLGCNVSKRGYSPMRYNPNNKKEERRDDSGDLLDKYNQKKEKSKNKFKHKRNFKTISNNSKDNSLDVSSNNSRRNNKSMQLLKKDKK